MNLFALTNNPGSRILRFPLNGELQNDIEEVFETQMNAFLAGIEEVIPFDGRYRPGQGELLAINDFADVDGLQDAVNNPLAVDQFDPLFHTYDCMKALFTSCEVDGAQRILIQLFESRRLIATKGLAIFYSGNTFQKMSDAGLTLDTKLLAVLEGTQLKFQSFHFMRRVFDLTEYFREATNEEVITFAGHDKLSVQDVPGFVAAASAFTRSKIALIRQSGVLDNFTATQIVAAAESCNMVIHLAPDGRIELPTNGTELRRVLRFLDEDYYKSPLTQTHFISNSKRVAD